MKRDGLIAKAADNLTIALAKLTAGACLLESIDDRPVTIALKQIMEGLEEAHAARTDIMRAIDAL